MHFYMFVQSYVHIPEWPAHMLLTYLIAGLRRNLLQSFLREHATTPLEVDKSGQLERHTNQTHCSGK